MDHILGPNGNLYASVNKDRKRSFETSSISAYNRNGNEPNLNGGGSPFVTSSNDGSQLGINSTNTSMTIAGEAVNLI